MLPVTWSALRAAVRSMSSNRELKWEIQEAQWERDYLDDDDGTADLQCQLLDAIRGRNVKKFKRIIDLGIDTHFVDDFGSSPLHIAVNQPSSAKLQEIIHILVYFGTSLHLLDRFGRTALHIAARTSANYVLTLLEAGCKTDVQDNAGRTPLMEACSCDSKESLAILQYLLDRKANIHIVDCDGMTALHCVCDNLNQDTVIRKELVYKLLYAGLSSTILDKRGRLPICYELHHIDKRNSEERLDERFSVIRALISSGIGFDLSNNDHRHWLLKSLNACSPLFQSQLFCVAEPALVLSTIKKIHRHSCSVVSDDDDYAKFKAYLHNMTRNPRSLKALCRIVVRDKLDGFILVKSELLPLPQTVKDYLVLIE